METPSGQIRASGCYICQNNNPEIVKQSSSGGIFYLLAEVTLQKNGVVVGAGFNRNFAVCHSCAESIESARTFMGSKYVQSDMGNVFGQIKAFLAAGREVLFSGTPCQIGGLERLLGKKPDNLTTMGFICHGVPSPLIYRRYLAQISHGRKIKTVSFRDKTLGWHRFSMKITFEDGTQYSAPCTEDAYLKGFLRDLYLRPSCHQCAFKAPHLPGDLTLGDFWGAEVFRPDLDNDTGLSVVMVHTEKGRHMWDSIHTKTRADVIGVAAVADRNSAYVQSATASPLKAPFRKKLRKNNNDLEKTIRYFYQKNTGSAKLLWKAYSKASCVFHDPQEASAGASFLEQNFLYSHKQHCCGCTACFSVCAKRAITMVPDQEGFLYPEIDHGLCIRCGSCRLVCPIPNLTRSTL